MWHGWLLGRGVAKRGQGDNFTKRFSWVARYLRRLLAMQAILVVAGNPVLALLLPLPLTRFSRTQKLMAWFCIFPSQIYCQVQTPGAPRASPHGSFTTSILFPPVFYCIT